MESILNDTYDDDQKRSHADIMELSLQMQFDSRSPSTLLNLTLLPVSVGKSVGGPLKVRWKSIGNRLLSRLLG